MPRTNRVIFKNKVYEVVSRAREGLPLPPTQLTNTLLKGIMARTQRDNKVTLCNFIWMNNHSHKQLIPNNPENLPSFYGEVQKKITDTLRTLLGRKWLRIWEDRTGVIMIDGLEDAIDRLVYMFCNPAKAGLVDTIDNYPGLSTWSAFLNCEPDVEAEVHIEAPWYRVDDLPLLPSSHSLSEIQDTKLTQELNSSLNAIPHTLIVKPFAWLKLFGISKPEEIIKIRERIVKEVRVREKEYAEERAKAKRKVIGVQALKSQVYLKPHIPKEKSRKIFVICSDKKRRIRLISMFKAYFLNCKRCFKKRKRGFKVQWPKGTFTPWIPPARCAIVSCKAF
jgi:hypothetical protein